MVRYYTSNQVEQNWLAKASPLLLRKKANRKWLLIGWLIYEKGLFNPIPEHSKIGLKAAKLLLHQPIELISYWLNAQQWGALIGWLEHQKGCFNPIFQLPVIIRFVTGWHKHVTDKSSETCYGWYEVLGTKSKTLNLLSSRNCSTKLPAIILSCYIPPSR